MIRRPALRAPWLGKFGRQIIADVLRHVALCLLAGVALFIAIDSVETGNMMKSSSPVVDLLKLQAFSVPLIVEQLFGVCVFLGTTTALAALARRQEIMALRSAGAAPAAMLKPVAVSGLIFAVGFVGLTEWVLPRAHTSVSELRRSLGLPSRRGSAVLSGAGGRWFRGEDQIFRVGALASGTGHRLSDVLVLEVADGRVISRSDADRIEFDGAQWFAHDLVRRSFLADGSMKTERSELRPIAIRERPADFVRSVGAPHLSTIAGLRQTIRARSRLGHSTITHRLALYRRGSIPLILLLSACLAAAIALTLGARPTFARALGIGSACGFGYWVVDELIMALGSTGAVAPAMAASLGVIVLIVLLVRFVVFLDLHAGLN